MDRLLNDLAHGFRRLERAPGFAVVAVLTLALGIGANTAIFSLIKTVLLQPLPYGDADRLAMVWASRDRGEVTWLAGPEVRSYGTEAGVFEEFAAYTTTAVNLTGGQEPERVIAAGVTPNLFRTLRVAAQVGRAFSTSDGPATYDDYVVLGYGLWQRRFGGQPDVIGKSIQMNGRARTVVGVMPPTFRLPLEFADERPSEIWVPLDLDRWTSWGDHSLIGFARLRGDATLASATGAMEALERRWVADGNWSNRDLSGRRAVAMKELVVGDVGYALWVLLGSVAVILLIACANVANLTLARSDERHREIAVRTALGAARGRIVRQLVTESLLVSAIGGALGVALAYGGLRLLLALHPADIPRVGDTAIDVGVLVFAAALSLATGVAFGLAPAMELSRPDLNRALKEGGRTGTVGRAPQRFRDSLAVAQMGLSVVLLIGAMLLVRSFIHLRAIDLGFRRENVLTFRTALPQSSYPEQAQVIGFYRTLRQQLGALPGVQSVGATRLLPLTGTIGDWSITLEGRTRVPGENPNGDWQVVTPGYFETMGIRLTRGRLTTDGDHDKAPLVAVINETMAGRYWPTEDAIGRRFHLGTGDQPWITVVGITRQVRHNAVTETPRAEMYVPHAQWAAAGASPPRAMTFAIRTAGDPMAALTYARQAVRALDPNLPMADIKTLDRVASDSYSQARFTTSLLALFAGLALLLAALGIYGVIALLVTRRRQEIGIRIALGARPLAVLGMVLRRGLRLAAVGVVLGVGCALLLTRVLGSLLYGVSRFDAATFAGVPALLGVVALVACLIPASRAATVNPVVALRDE